MIRIQNENGHLVRVLKVSADETVIFDRFFGFVTPQTWRARHQWRRKNGLKSVVSEPEFTMRWTSPGQLEAEQNCQVLAIENGWQLISEAGVFKVDFVEDQTKVIALNRVVEEKRIESNKWLALPAALGVLLFLLAFFYPQAPPQVQTEVAPPAEPVIVQMEKPRIVVPQEQPKPIEPEKQTNQALDKEQKVKKALTQNLGFLKMLGRKDLKKAVGGLPTSVPEASPGAGPGGKEGSGGELLAGMGEGLRKTTVGNSGVAGLGGVGTKGAGGGLGGYGETDYGSGAGRSLSTIPLSQDAVVEGGLDRSLILATIMRYLSQVRACYEEGLKRKSDMIGQVTMNFEINGGGGLNFSRVQRSSLGDREVEQCISTRMMTWKFPTPRGGVNVKVSYPFMLRPVKS